MILVRLCHVTDSRVSYELVESDEALFALADSVADRPIVVSAVDLSDDTHARPPWVTPETELVSKTFGNKQAEVRARVRAIVNVFPKRLRRALLWIAGMRR